MREMVCCCRAWLVRLGMSIGALDERSFLPEEVYSYLNSSRSETWYKMTELTEAVDVRSFSRHWLSNGYNPQSVRCHTRKDDLNQQEVNTCTSA